MKGPLKFPELNLTVNLGSMLKVLVIWAYKYLNLKPRLFQTISARNPGAIQNIIAVTKIHPEQQTQQQVHCTFLEIFAFRLSILFLMARVLYCMLHALPLHLPLLFPRGRRESEVLIPVLTSAELENKSLCLFREFFT